MPKNTCFYYVNDKNRKVYSLPYSPDTSDEAGQILFVYPLYNNNFVVNGKLKIEINYFFQDEIGYFNYIWTFYFNATKSTVSGNYNFMQDRGQTDFPPGVIIPIEINNGSGVYFDKNGLIEILPFDNNAKSRMVTITTN